MDSKSSQDSLVADAFARPYKSSLHLPFSITKSQILFQRRVLNAREKMSETRTSMKGVKISPTTSSANSTSKSSFLGVKWNKSAMSRISPHSSPRASPKPSPCSSPALQRKHVSNPQSTPSPAMRRKLAAKKC